ncbi:EAL domain-containing protein [Colwellia sp. MEBiC06753]
MQDFKHSQLTSLIESEDLFIVFQPIFDVTQNKPLGYEALTRTPDGHSIKNPTELFSLAEHYDCLSTLELLCRKLAIENFARLNLDGNLFINVSPHTIAQQKHPFGETLNFVKQAGLTPERVVIEVTECYQTNSPELLKKSSEHYRQCGFKIAIDDLGTGHSGLKQWAELRPDIVKIDRYFISDCTNNIIKRELLRTIFELGRATNVGIVAEGIETVDEYLLLKKLGLRYAQGFLLARPNQQPFRKMPEEIAGKTVATEIASEFELTSLLKDTPAVSPTISCKEIYTAFKQNKSMQSLVIVDTHKVPVGIVYRDQLAEVFSGDYGHALYDKKPISELMEPVNFTVEVSTSLDSLSSIITDNEHFDKRPDFIVVKQGRYLGVGNVRLLLKKMTEEKIKHARHANPLTMLPGNVIIQQRIRHLLLDKRPFEMAYFDLDNFKPFNDIYGYAAGDEVIVLVSEILNQLCKGELVGHVGGDDFVVIFVQHPAEQMASDVMATFRERIKLFFHSKHLAEQGYHAISRDGKATFYALLNISCGIIQPDVNQISTAEDVAKLAALAKKGAKESGSEQPFILSITHLVNHLVNNELNSVVNQ